MADISIYEAMVEKISIHHVRALAGEVYRGKLSKPQVLGILLAAQLEPLNAAQTIEFDDLWDKLVAGTVTPTQLEECFFLVEANLYTIDQAKASMGIL